MNTLNQKLAREIWRNRSQMLAIAFVIAGGVAVCLMSIFNYYSLAQTRDAYYQTHQFSEVFVHVTRAPMRLAQRVKDIENVARVDARIDSAVKIRLSGFDHPIQGKLLSLAEHQASQLNKLTLTKGRLPYANRDNEIIVIGSFVEAHDLALGDTLDMIVNGRWQRMTIVGVAESPEFIYVIPPGSMLPDFERYAVMWMPYQPLAAVMDMTGAFNSMQLKAKNAKDIPGLIEQLDKLFKPYGSTGAYDRDRHYSARIVEDELDQIKSMAIVFPGIMMSVAMFLISVVVGRMVGQERDVIGTLKAFGYRNLEIGLHYCKLITLIAAVGCLIGAAGGIGLGQAMVKMYSGYFRFPDLNYVLPWYWLIFVFTLTIAMSLLGAWRAIKLAVNLTPAEAMRPEAPPVYKKTMLETLALRIRFRQASLMILRQLERRPLRSLFSILGIAMATAIVVLGSFLFDSITVLVHSQFQRAQQADLFVSLIEEEAPKVVHEVSALPGVLYVEASRSIPIRLRAGHRHFRTDTMGLQADARLSKRLDKSLNSLPAMTDGLWINDYLAQTLQVRVGDSLVLEWLDGSDKQITIPLAGISEEFMGTRAYMNLDQLNRVRGNGERVNLLQVNVAPSQRTNVIQTLELMPGVAGLSERKAMLDAFFETVGKTFLSFTFFNAILGIVIAFGVIYNLVRLSLAERGRELASLRVLGYRKSELDHILIGELSLMLVIGIPMGWVIGKYLALGMATGLQTELFRIPLVISDRTLGLSASVVVLSALVSSLIAVFRISRLDLIAVLKTRE